MDFPGAPIKPGDQHVRKQITCFSGGKIMKRPASLVVGILLLVLACAQLGRFIWGVSIIAAGMKFPLWPSAMAAVVLAALAIWLLKERNK
jgi:hypothetical protein